MIVFNDLDSFGQLLLPS